MFKLPNQLLAELTKYPVSYPPTHCASRVKNDALLASSPSEDPSSPLAQHMDFYQALDTFLSLPPNRGGCGMGIGEGARAMKAIKKGVRGEVRDVGEGKVAGGSEGIMRAYYEGGGGGVVSNGAEDVE